MTRTKLPDRRPSITERVKLIVGNHEKNVLMTFGFTDHTMKVPHEVFCADWKAGTALHDMVIDDCILVSRLLQHGDRASELVKTLCDPPSLVGQIAAAVARHEVVA